jgi:tetratricopeptide (TPR) repeat protein
MLDTGTKLLAIDPKNLSVLYTMTYMGRPGAVPGAKYTPEMIDATEKAAKTLIGSIDSLRPANVSDADWKKTASAAVAEAHTTLGVIAQQRKDNEGAEKEFKASLKENPNTGQVPYYLATVILAQKKPETQAEALFYFARTAAYDGTGALSAAGRKEVLTYLTKIYTTFHGSKDDLDQLLATAKANAMPPAGFIIKTGPEIEAEKNAEFAKNNPEVALWKGIKDQLTAADGEQYFSEKMKDAAVPKLKGVLISQKPARNAKELVIGIMDPKTPEVTLKITDAVLPGSVDPGAEISWEGIPTAFTKEPFNVTFDVEKAKIEGWTGKATPPARKGGAPKKAATKQ